ncbi:MAG: YdeI/OmpD-associated family protein [Opitutaceae bacterium]|nr:YdeI/OmpD-associated family protein [Opitutaceae bacterium]
MTKQDTTKLRARLYQVALVRWVDIPKVAVATLGLTSAAMKGTAQGWNAVLHFNGDMDRVTLLPGKRGHYKLAFKVELLQAAGVDAGATIEFALARDAASREPDLPDAMRQAFQARPHLAERWTAHSIASRRQVVRYILQAKSPEVQAKRCWLFVERLAETGQLSGD